MYDLWFYEQFLSIRILNGPVVELPHEFLHLIIKALTAFCHVLASCVHVSILIKDSSKCSLIFTV